MNNQNRIQFTPLSVAFLTPKERKKCAGAMICLIQGIVGRNVVVELKGGRAIQGLLKSCDSAMNLEIGGAQIYSLKRFQRNDSKNPDQNGTFFISGSHISFIHLDSHIDAIGIMEKTIRALIRPPPKIKNQF
ncbi:hypothetical protein AB6A40_010939 [Gnathostoma spinigerum]|uniref:Sm domain-containing protein n=1 Tax=Gnathostoma spinigerum TaxID=75299 RepID=A0ABD6EWB4_9BILA